MIIDQFVATWDNVLSEDFCQKAIEWFENYDQEIIANPEKLSKEEFNGIRNGGFANGIERRKDIAYFMETDKSPEAQQICQTIKSTVNSCVKEYILEYSNLSHLPLHNVDTKIQKTAPHGGYHIWHEEYGMGFGSASRVLVWCLYLNNIPEGEGETEFLYQGIKCQPKTGRVVIFPAYFTHLHRGNPPYKSDKYIATGWFTTLLNGKD